MREASFLTNAQSPSLMITLRENASQNAIKTIKIIDEIKTIRCRNKKRPDENTIVDYLCKSYPDCNVTTIRQRITYLENKNKILNLTMVRIPTI